jgi:hypothetical protein
MATDYPHRDGFFSGAPQMIEDRMGSARRPMFSTKCWPAARWGFRA